MCVIHGNAVIELSTLRIWFIYKYVDDKANIGKYKTILGRGGCADFICSKPYLFLDVTKSRFIVNTVLQCPCVCKVENKFNRFRAVVHRKRERILIWALHITYYLQFTVHSKNTWTWQSWSMVDFLCDRIADATIVR